MRAKLSVMDGSLRGPVADRRSACRDQCRYGNHKSNWRKLMKSMELWFETDSRYASPASIQLPKPSQNKIDFSAGLRKTCRTFPELHATRHRVLATVPPWRDAGSAGGGTYEVALDSEQLARPDTVRWHALVDPACIRAGDRKSTRLNSSHVSEPRMPS